MYRIARQLLFRLSPEAAHNVVMSLLSVAGRTRLISLLSPPAPVCQPTRVMGIDFPNPVGLAAGLDKNGEAIDGLAGLGFGFLEVGTVTPRPQPGNPQPRIFRFPPQEAIINRMGFNNQGIDALVHNVRRSRFKGILGINIGKNFDTPIENAADDYLACMEKAYPWASYLAVNLSSPNTPGLRALQTDDYLPPLLAKLKAAQARLASDHGKYVPLAIKVAPDLDDQEIATIARALLVARVDGLIATNTTLSRKGLEGVPGGDETGGMSGAPLRDQSTRVIRKFVEALEGKIPVIGVGGIHDAAAGVEKIQAGAQLVQIYSGFIFHGPGLIGQVATAIDTVARSIKQG